MKVIKYISLVLCLSCTAQSNPPVKWRAQEFGMYYLLEGKKLKSMTYTEYNRTFIILFTDGTTLEISSDKYFDYVNF